jgi:hypothetical protein
MVRLRHQTPTREWTLVVEESKEELLVVREWPNGSHRLHNPDSGGLEVRPIPQASPNPGSLSLRTHNNCRA